MPVTGKPEVELTIKRLQFKDRFLRWELNPTSFSDFNLLVGKSGVGKTQALSVFRALRTAGIRNVRGLNGCSWSIEVVAEDRRYNWIGETSLVESGYGSDNSDFSSEDGEADYESAPTLVSERIEMEGREVPLVSRTTERFDFDGKSLPRLKSDCSAITLLKDEEVIAPLYTALKRIMFSETPELSAHRSARFLLHTPDQLKSLRARYGSLQTLREATDVPVLIRALILQDDYPERFNRLTAEFTDIFPRVTEVRVGRLGDFESGMRHDTLFDASITVAIKERGVSDWIVESRLSSGMFRTLIHLLELELAPPGTVIVIDELENSLGMNCLDEVVSNLLARSDDLQFIVTSHHPYVINSVPVDRWRIVSRNGSVVTLQDARSIPALNGVSAHENFMRLINLTEYEESIR